MREFAQAAGREPCLDARRRLPAGAMKHLTRALVSVLALAAAPLGAHPHIFVDTAMRFEVNDKAEITGVTMTWIYDDFFSLLIFEDMGLDPDGDAILTDAELDQLFGFDLVEWPEGFEGDLYVYSNGEKIEMPRPRPIGIAVEDGLIIATQFREIPAVPVDGLLVQQYDPTYYVAYDVSQGVTFTNPACTATVTDPDIEAAQAVIEEEVSGNMEDIFNEMRVGIHFSDKIEMTCAQPSN
jgi:ABC-type uncharacterized transport system substrate-binding protein